jgi:hypothetical protein
MAQQVLAALPILQLGNKTKQHALLRVKDFSG